MSSNDGSTLVSSSDDNINDANAHVTCERTRPNENRLCSRDDIVFQRLTVYENLMFAARLRLQRDMSDLQRELVVKDVVDMLQLAHVQGSLVGGAEKRGISGGQRKRVNIGMELAAGRERPRPITYILRRARARTRATLFIQCRRLD